MEDASTQVCPLFYSETCFTEVVMLYFGGISTRSCNMMPLVDRICNDLNVTNSVSSLEYYDQQNSTSQDSATLEFLS